MNFDIGEVLSHAWQITWKHKVLWVFSALPVLLGFLVLPLVFIPMILMGTDSRGNLLMLQEPLFIGLFVAANIILSLVSFVLYAIGTSSIALGVLRSEDGADPLKFWELFNESKTYLWRLMGVMLLITLGVSTIFLIFFGGMTLFGLVTAGLGFLCIQPFFLILYPVMMMLYAVIEQSQAAVVADNLGVTEAITRGWNLIRENFWKFFLISLIIYFGLTFLSSIILVPFMMPLFFIPFLLENQQGQLNTQSLILMMAGLSVVLLPVMAFVQGITITFMKVTYMLVYLRLTRGSRPQPALQMATT